MILITGTTGTTGRPLVEHVIAADIPARAIVRDPGQADKLRARGLQVVTGDLRDEAVLAAALMGVERAFLLTANSDGQAALEIRFIDAAVTAGVAHVVKLSAIGADSGSPAVLKRYHGRAEDHLRAAPLAHTIVQANFFMDNLLHSAPAIARDGAFALPLGSGRVGAIDVRDVAEAAFTVLTRPGHENRSYVITGPEVLSFGEMAAILSDELGREIRYIDMPAEEFRALMIGLGQNAWYVDATLQLFALIREDRNAAVTETFTAVTGRPPRAFRQFVRDRAHRFGPTAGAAQD